MSSLENVCLDLIVHEFKRFYFIFTVSNEGTLKKCFDFLQRKYTYDLLLKLDDTKKLKNEYMDFFINKYLKVLNSSWFEKSSIKDKLCRLPNLTEIHRCYVYGSDDQILRNIAKFCPKIVEIEAKCSEVTDTEIKYLCKNEIGEDPCPDLRNLFINGSKVTAEGVKYLLQNKPSLERIDSTDIPVILYSLHKNDLPNLEIARSYNLVDIEMFNLSNLAHYFDILKICLAVCPRLKTINCEITDEEQLHLFNNRSWEEAVLNFRKPNINIKSFLANCGPNLVYLDVVNCILSIDDLAVRCPKLQHLRLKKVTFLDDNDDSEPIFHHLSKCDFTKCERAANDKTIDKVVRLLLLNSPNLEYLSFYNFYISSDIKASILKCCEKQILKKIFLAHLNNELKFFKDILLSCTSLRKLNLLRCCCWDERERLAEILRTLPNKPELYIDWSYIDY